MVMTDPIADMFSSLLNARRAGKEETVVPFSSLKERIARLLKDNGYLEEVRKFKESGGSRFLLALRGPRLEHAQKLSKPGQRWYISWQEIQRPPQGVRIISTSKGIMTHKEARHRKLGGEQIGEVW